MTTYQDLREYLDNQNAKVIIAADAETRISTVGKDGEVTTHLPAGGVAVALDPIAKAAGATYIARAKSDDEKKALDKDGKIHIVDPDGSYSLKPLFLSEDDVNSYYYGFANQILWPLCHVVFQEPIFNQEWFEGYKKVNELFAKAIQKEIKGKTIVWVNDYQLALVPYFLGKQKDVTVGMFWHIPWPTWERFRILPWKRELLESILTCDFLGFHRGYQAQNFINTVEHEFETRVDREQQQIHINSSAITVKGLPMGVDTDVIKTLVKEETSETLLSRIIREALNLDEKKEETALDEYFSRYQVLFGVDRLDYTKGIDKRLLAIDKFFTDNPAYRGKVIYLGIVAPSREVIPSYKEVKRKVEKLAQEINARHHKGTWKPIHLIHQVFPRADIINFYNKARVCLVTPLDDGMNLVSKEFVTASALSPKPGMLVLSRFAGSAIDLTKSLLVNPYDIPETALAIKKAIEMPQNERIEKVRSMAETLDEHNVYLWAQEFFRNTLQAKG